MDIHYLVGRGARDEHNVTRSVLYKQIYTSTSAVQQNILSNNTHRRDFEILIIPWIDVRSKLRRIKVIQNVNYVQISNTKIPTTIYLST